MSDQSPGPRWWRASDGRWYPPETHPDYGKADHPEGWWLASDGKWYPPRPQASREPEPEPTAAVHPEPEPTRFNSASATERYEVPDEAVRPHRQAVVAVPWTQRKGVRITGGVLGGLLLIGLIGGALEEDEEPSERLRSELVDATVATVVENSTTLLTSTTTPTSSTATTTAATTVPVPSTVGTTLPAVTSPSPTAAPVRQGVTPGAFCSPAGASGLTSAGTAMECRHDGEDRARWRRAA